MEREKLLMREYETITAQIVHWDSHFWHKSKFFLAIESILLAVIAQRLSTELVDNVPMHQGLFFLFGAVVLFNLFLCYVWFRTNRSNREYLKVRFDRALKIESDPDLKGVVQLYDLQQATLSKPEYVKHSASLWEIHLPTAFMLAWVASLIAAAYDSRSLSLAIVAGSTILIVIMAIAFVEKTGWPGAIRETILPSSDHEQKSRGNGGGQG